MQGCELVSLNFGINDVGIESHVEPLLELFAALVVRIVKGAPVKMPSSMSPSWGVTAAVSRKSDEAPVCQLFSIERHA